MKVVTMNDLIDQWHSLCKTNTGRCANDNYKSSDINSMPYENEILTFFLNKSKEKVSIQDVINSRIIKIKGGDHGMAETYEDAILELAAKAADAMISYVEFQSGVELRLGRH